MPTTRAFALNFTFLDAYNLGASQTGIPLTMTGEDTHFPCPGTPLKWTEFFQGML